MKIPGPLVVEWGSVTTSSCYIQPIKFNCQYETSRVLLPCQCNLESPGLPWGFHQPNAEGDSHKQRPLVILHQTYNRKEK